HSSRAWPMQEAGWRVSELVRRVYAAVLPWRQGHACAVPFRLSTFGPTSGESRKDDQGRWSDVQCFRNLRDGSLYRPPEQIGCSVPALARPCRIPKAARRTLDTRWPCCATVACRWNAELPG